MRGSSQGKDPGFEEGQGVRGQRHHLGTDGRTDSTNTENMGTPVLGTLDRQTALVLFLSMGSRRLARVPISEAKCSMHGALPGSPIWGRNRVKVRGPASLRTTQLQRPPFGLSAPPPPQPARLGGFQQRFSQASIGLSVGKSHFPIPARGSFASLGKVSTASPIHTSLTLHGSSCLVYPSPCTDNHTFSAAGYELQSPFLPAMWARPSLESPSTSSLQASAANLMVPIFPPITQGRGTLGRNSCCAQMWADY